MKNASAVDAMRTVPLSSISGLQVDSMTIYPDSHNLVDDSGVFNMGRKGFAAFCAYANRGCGGKKARCGGTSVPG